MSVVLWLTLIFSVWHIGHIRFAARRLPVRVRITDRRPARARTGPPSLRRI